MRAQVHLERGAADRAPDREDADRRFRVGDGRAGEERLSRCVFRSAFWALNWK